MRPLAELALATRLINCFRRHVMKMTGSLLLASVLVVASLGAQGAGQGSSRPVPFGVGDRIPQFHAPDQEGKERQFSDLVGAKGLVIFFFKSADW
jgi:hypothetical protein